MSKLSTIIFGFIGLWWTFLILFAVLIMNVWSYTKSNVRNFTNAIGYALGQIVMSSN
jgi:hypothetical protein